VVCPEGWPCTVTCSGQNACRATTITCAPDHACEVSCEALAACRDSAVVCGAGTCDVHCVGNANDVCRNFTVECGPADTTLVCDATADMQILVPFPAGTCECAQSGCA